MAPKGNTFGILQLDPRLITLLKVRRGDKGLDVEAYVQEPLEPRAGGGLEAALRDFVRKHGVAEHPVYTVLPRHEMTARILTLPSQELNEIRGMVRLNAEEYVPYPVDELVIDQCVLQRLPDGHARVLAVFAHKDIVDTHVELCRKAGIEPHDIYVSTPCLASAAAAAQGGDAAPYAVVHVAAGGVEVLVMNGRRLEYGRAVASHHNGKLEEVSPEDLAAELATELRSSLAAYRREVEDGSAVAEIYVGSDWTDPGVLCPALSQDTGHVCVPAPFAKELVTRGGEHLQAVPLTALGAALAAQGRAPLELSLVPRSLVETRAEASRKRRMTTMAVAVGVLLAALGIYYAQATHQRNAYLDELKAELAEKQPEAEGVLEKFRQLKILQRQVNPNGSALEVLARVSEAAPAAGVNITKFVYERGASAIVSGRAKNVDDITHFAESLREKGGPLYAQAQGGRMDRVREPNNEEVVDYTIEIPFPAAPASEEEAASEPAE